MSDYLKAVQERVVIYDGAMGTAIQAYNLPLDEFWGKDGYNDILVLSRPDIVKEIHAKYFEAGLMLSRPTPSIPARWRWLSTTCVARCGRLTRPLQDWRVK